MKLVNKFNPLQPEWKKNIQSLQMSKTSPPFQNSIAFVYQFKTKGNINENILFPSIPNGCIDLLFHLDGIQSQCLLVPSPKKRTFLPFSAYSTYFGIRLFPLQKLFPFQLSLKEINSEKAFSLFEVAPYLRPLYELLLQKHTFIEQMQLLECYLKHPRNSQLYSTIVASCINKIIFHHGHLHVKDLEQFTGYSERYLRLLFQKELGIPPKTFLQLVNFQYIINDIVKGDFHIEKHLNENLYYDSSHFYKTFKKFTNMTPGEYRKILVDEV
ncbi:helix-turn-helix transcriptional regulator [Ureibacillus sp. 179-F W5.1 NHS]|uniref:AraC family transcriptional regulator n=2 Tax=Bacillales TaxID=1385 RepID=A0A3M8HFH4_9BACI|nr:MULTISPECIES: response regulator transcription factor [Bacillales]MBD8027442.1 helix-turn-helix transcriptional regulator [Ureibacillus galli]RND01160.1 AraC family transcriptional regulator [Lysinibacillus halotolerans]